MNILNRFYNYRKYKNTLAELNRLSERELADIGMSRSDIYSSARKAVYK